MIEEGRLMGGEKVKVCQLEGGGREGRKERGRGEGGTSQLLITMSLLMKLFSPAPLLHS